jgi:fluoroquinolone resistance protein
MIQPGIETSEQSFKDLDLSQVILKSNSFHDCRFERCNFVEAHFQNCRFVNCIFKNCDLSLAQIPNCSFSGTRFENSKVIGINWAQAHWSENALWDPLEFTKCPLSHSTFLGVDLTGIKIRRCEAINVDFRESDLTQADFSFTDLKESLFLSTNLSGADLRYARNYTIDPSQNTINGAKFSLPEAMSLLYSMDIQIIEP